MLFTEICKNREFFDKTGRQVGNITSINANESDKLTIKPKNQNRNKENRQQIIDFIADNGVSDAKSISKAIGLKPSRTRDYLKQLVDEGILETEGEYKNRNYRIKK